MKNNKGWLRIVEAFIAILIVGGVLIYMATKEPAKSNTDSIHEFQRAMLEEISLNETLRGEILSNDARGTESFVGNNTPLYLNFSIRICEVSDACGIGYIGKAVYADEILISSNLTKYSPKKLKLFLWEN